MALYKFMKLQNMFEEKSVLVGMSGGIDSTAVCSMLLEQGYKVMGLTLITSDTGLRAAKDAAELAARLGTIPPKLYEVPPQSVEVMRR